MPLMLQGMLDGQYPGQYAITTAGTLGEAKAIVVRRGLNAVLLDLSLPDSQGLETIGRLVGFAELTDCSAYRPAR